MKKVGQILQTVALAASVGLAGVAGYLWWQEAQRAHGLEQNLEAARVEQQQLQAQLDRTVTEKRQVESDVVRLRAEAAQRALELDQARGERDTLKQQLQSRADQLSQMEQRLTALEGERQQLSEALTAANSALTRLRPPTGASAPADEQDAYIRLEPVVVQQEGQAASAAPQDQSQPAAAPAEATAPLQGEILFVDRKYDFVVVNRGRSHGVDLGQRFAIQRGEQTVGYAQVEKVYENLCAASIQESDPETIHEGDTAQRL